MRIETIVESGRPVAQHATLTVVAQDPSVRAGDRLLTARVRIPAEHLEPGPRGARFHVVDYDGELERLEPPATLLVDDSDPFADADEATLLSAPAFRAQNVYAVAARTLAAFESALGRRVAWGFGGHQLFLVPRALPEANAFYSPDDGAIYFGYVPDSDPPVQTALSHDIVAHETTHAILDGLRPRYVEPGLPDQRAFHEALADCVALLSVFSLPAVVARLLGDGDADGRLPAVALGEEALGATALFTLAEQLGIHRGARGAGLRRSVDLNPSAAWRSDPTFEEAHRRGEIVVAAVMRTLLRMWARRLPAITGARGADRDRVVEEGAKAAGHLLRMLIRGIDYMPPVDLEFEDVLDAVLIADEVVAPDDEHGYRGALAESFASFGIVRPEGRTIDLSRTTAPVYERINHAVLRSDRDEALRFLWENAEPLEIDRRWRMRIEFLRPSVRVGPHGLVVEEIITAYVQSVELSAGEAAEVGVEIPPRIPAGTALQMWGGGVVAFDQFGRAKLHQRKPLGDWGRQSRRFAHLVARGLGGERGIGFREGKRASQFVDLHVPDVRAAEVW